MVDKKRLAARRNIAENRRARFDYEILDTYEAAAECPNADRPNPSRIPGKSAATR